MGVEEIVEQISSDANQKSEKILSEAETKRAEVLKEAQVRAQERHDKVLARGSEEAKVALQRIVGSAKMSLKKEELKVKEAILDEVFDKAGDKLEGLKGAKYEKALTKLIKESASEMKDFKVVVDKSGKSSASKAAKKAKVRCSVVTEAMSSGIKLRSKDGKVEIDQTFEARLERKRDQLRIEAAKVLFA